MRSSAGGGLPRRPVEPTASAAARVPVRLVWAIGLPFVAVATLGVMIAPPADQVLWCNAQVTVSLLVATAVVCTSLGGNGDRAAHRRSLCLALAGVTAGWLAWDVQTYVGWLESPTPSDLTITASTALGILTLARLGLENLERIDLHATFLDGATVLGATLAAYAVFLDQATPLTIPIAPMVVFPPVLLALALTTLVGSLALRLAPRSGAYAVFGGLVVGGAALVAFAPSVPEGMTIDERMSHGLTLAFLLIGRGFSMLRLESSSDPRFTRIARLILTAAPFAAVLFIAGLIVAPFDLGPDARLVLGGILAVTLVLAALRQTLLVVERDRLLGREQAALGREQAARREAVTNLGRAVAAEAVQRERAELLARILGASESLAAAGGADPAYAAALTHVVPAGAVGFVARLDEGGRTATLVAVHGPGSGRLAGLVLPADTLRVTDPGPGGRDTATPEPPGEEPAGEAPPGEAPAGEAPAGEAPAGEAMLPELREALGLPADGPPAARLTLGLRDHLGEPLGALGIVDREPERLTDPTFVDLARLVANQLAVTMENARLVSQLAHQVERLVRMQGHLVRTSRLAAVGETAARVAHEVNNPLQAVLGNTELLLARLPADDPQREDVEVIRTETLRARTFIRDLLAAASPDRSRLGRMPGDVVWLVRRVLDEEVHAATSERAVRFHQRIRPLPFVNLDTESMVRALRSLFADARRALAERGTITVTTRLEGDTAVIAIAAARDPEPDARPSVDRRIGRIPDEDVPDVGAPGADGSVNDAVAIVEAHGGSATIEERAEAVRVTTVRLPLAELVPGIETGGSDPGSGHAADVVRRSSTRRLLRHDA